MKFSISYKKHFICLQNYDIAGEKTKKIILSESQRPKALLSTLPQTVVGHGGHDVDHHL